MKGTIAMIHNEAMKEMFKKLFEISDFDVFISKDNEEIARLCNSLINLGELDISGEEGANALKVAVENNLVSLARVLVRKGAPVAFNDGECIEYLVRHNYSEILSILLYSPQASEISQECLNKALCLSVEDKLIRGCCWNALMYAGADPLCNDSFPLTQAILQGSKKGGNNVPAIDMVNNLVHEAEDYRNILHLMHAKKNIPYIKSKITKIISALNLAIELADKEGNEVLCATISEQRDKIQKFI